tara:strand:+ start:10361 stop:11029 length:669 start_codon:yes stop_codon:yes gene_type:complete
MPIEVLFSEKDIQKLIDTNNTPKFGPRNTALIFGLSYWGLERKEVCQLPLSAVMSESGQWYKSWFIPAEYSYNGEERELHTADHVVPVLDEYIGWLKQKGVGTSNLHTYRKLNPEMKLFVNDRLTPFELTERSTKKKDGSVSYQTRSLDDKLKSFIKNSGIEGATVGTFRDSWIKMMYEAGCGYNDLKAVSGIKTKSTLDAKIRPLERELEKVFNSVFSRIN